eukprot:20924-Heterococcus_DN1.PRE.3
MGSALVLQPVPMWSASAVTVAVVVMVAVYSCGSSSGSGGGSVSNTDNVVHDSSGNLTSYSSLSKSKRAGTFSRKAAALSASPHKHLNLSSGDAALASSASPTTVCGIAVRARCISDQSTHTTAN